MSFTLYWTWHASVAAAVATLLLLAWRHRSPRLLSLVLMMVAISAAVSYIAPDLSTTRDVSLEGSPAAGDGIHEIAAVTLCYLSMIFGMMAEYAYAQAEQGKKRFRFVPMTFVMPILASPIVFIPLLTIAGDVSAGGAFTRAKLMVYLVAFQNGFFWKSFFEQRRREVTEAGRS